MNRFAQTRWLGIAFCVAASMPGGYAAEPTDAYRYDPPPFLQEDERVFVLPAQEIEDRQDQRGLRQTLEEVKEELRATRTKELRIRRELKATRDELARVQLANKDLNRTIEELEETLRKYELQLAALRAKLSGRSKRVTEAESAPATAPQRRAWIPWVRRERTDEGNVFRKTAERSREEPPSMPPPLEKPDDVQAYAGEYERRIAVLEEQVESQETLLEHAIKALTRANERTVELEKALAVSKGAADVVEEVPAPVKPTVEDEDVFRMVEVTVLDDDDLSAIEDAVEPLDILGDDGLSIADLDEPVVTIPPPPPRRTGGGSLPGSVMPGVTIPLMNRRGLPPAGPDGTPPAEDFVVEWEQPMEQEELAPPDASPDELLTEANIKLRDGDTQGAERLFSAALEANPGLSEARLGLIACHYTRGDIETSERMVDEFLSKYPDNARALGLKGIIIWQQGDLKSARRTLQKALRRDPTDPQLHNYMGIIHHERNDFGRAVQAFRRSIELDPDYAEAQFNLAILLATSEKPQLDEARARYEAALQLGNRRDRDLEDILYP